MRPIDGSKGSLRGLASTFSKSTYLEPFLSMILVKDELPDCGKAWGDPNTMPAMKRV